MCIRNSAGENLQSVPALGDADPRHRSSSKCLYWAALLAPGAARARPVSAMSARAPALASPAAADTRVLAGDRLGCSRTMKCSRDDDL